MVGKKTHFFQSLNDIDKAMKKVFYTQFIVALISIYWIADSEKYLNIKLMPASVEDSIKLDLQVCAPIVKFSSELSKKPDLFDGYVDFIKRYDNIVAQATTSYKNSPPDKKLKYSGYDMLNGDYGLSKVSVDLILYSNDDYSGLPIQNLPRIVKTLIFQEEVNDTAIVSQIRFAIDWLNKENILSDTIIIPLSFKFPNYLSRTGDSIMISILNDCPDIEKFNKSYSRLLKFISDNNISDFNSTYNYLSSFLGNKNLNVDKAEGIQKIDLVFIPVDVERIIILIFLPLFFVFTSFMLINHYRNRMIAKQKVTKPEDEQTLHPWLFTSIENNMHLKMPMIEKIILHFWFYFGIIMPLIYQVLLIIYEVNYLDKIPAAFLILTILCLGFCIIAELPFLRLIFKKMKT